MAITTGFITGTGFYTLPSIQDTKVQEVETPYGTVSVDIGRWGDQEVAFIPRHGKKHTGAPGDINYRANIYAMHLLGVERILATSVVGSLEWKWGPGTLVLLSNIMNFSSGRRHTFYPLNGVLKHVFVTDPYCPTLQDHLLQQAKEMGIVLDTGAVYACFDGPRFETRAEIEMVRRLGGHLVGMTNYPECVLARELAICYTSVGVVTNYAAGMAKLSSADIRKHFAAANQRVVSLLDRVVTQMPAHFDCSCRHALDGAE